MSFTMIAPGSSPPVDVFSLPNAVSFCVTDSGSGGQINLNGLGVGSGTVAGAVDLKTFFGTGTPVLFRSIPLLRAFRVLTNPGTNLAAETQLVNNLHITIYPNGGTGLAAMPSVSYNGTVGAAPNVPFLQLNGPAVSGTWRVDIELRHSLTN